MKIEKLKRAIPALALTILFSFAGVVVKWASMSWEANGLFNLNTIVLVGFYLGLYAVYAVLWQKVIAKADLSYTFLLRSSSIIWTMLFSIIIFKNIITPLNLVGILLIMGGIIMVTNNG